MRNVRTRSIMETTIDNLSEDVLIEVFKRLDWKSLKEAALVCRNWNKLIGSTSSIMSKFTLRLRNRPSVDRWSDKFQELMSLERAFQSIDVSLCDKKKDFALFAAVTARHGSHVRCLDLYLHYMTLVNSIPDFGEILRNLPLLEDLRTCRLSYAESKLQKVSTVSTFRPVFMPRLKRVSALILPKYGDYCQLQLFIGSPIKYFQLTTDESANPTTKNDHEVLINFLKASVQLKVMKIDKCVFESIFKSPESSKFQFKLEEFSSISNNEAIQENFEKFLLTQASTLRELKGHSLSPGVIKTIINKLEKLDKLTFNCNCLPSDKRFYESLKPSKSLQVLDLDFDFPNDIAAKGLLGNCPNLKFLFFPSRKYHEVLQIVSINNPKIELLFIYAIRTKMDTEAKFRSLNDLNIESVPNCQNLLLFVRNNPTIETLSLSLLSSDTDNIEEFIGALSTQPNMKHLNLTSNYQVAKTIYEKVKVDYGRLQSLRLTVESDAKVLIFVFKFPIDKSKQEQIESRMRLFQSPYIGGS